MREILLTSAEIDFFPENYWLKKAIRELEITEDIDYVKAPTYITFILDQCGCVIGEEKKYPVNELSFLAVYNS